MILIKSFGKYNLENNKSLKYFCHYSKSATESCTIETLINVIECIIILYKVTGKQ